MAQVPRGRAGPYFSIAVCSSDLDRVREKQSDVLTIEIPLTKQGDIKAGDNRGKQILHFLARRTRYDKPSNTINAKARKKLMAHPINSGADPKVINAEQETPLTLVICWTKQHQHINSCLPLPLLF